VIAMVICPKCCEYYQFKDIQHDRKHNRYVCLFACDCQSPLKIEESEADQKGFLSDEDAQDALREKKIEIIQALIRESGTAPPPHLPGAVLTRRSSRDEPSPS
jgi:hypothetical protein